MDNVKIFMNKEEENIQKITKELINFLNSYGLHNIHAYIFGDNKLDEYILCISNKLIIFLYGMFEEIDAISIYINSNNNINFMNEEALELFSYGSIPESIYSDNNKILFENMNKYTQKHDPIDIENNLCKFETTLKTLIIDHNLIKN